jgi:hypothetical protein
MGKPVFALDSGVADAGLVPAGSASALEQILRRVVGDGAINLFRARSEVHAALGPRASPAPFAVPLDDAPPSRAIPSVAAGRRDDRVLAEIDQDGFAFALDPLDEPYFNRRSLRVPRQQNLVDVTLLEGRVCIRKRFRGYRFGARRWGGRPVPAQERALRALWVNLRLFLYSEAAALLRLHDLPFVPKVRAIDLADGALYLDYVQGESLRSVAAGRGAAVHDGELAGDPSLQRFSPRELERREVALLEAACGGGFRREIASMVRQVNARGVVPLDVKLGNFIRGAQSGRLYWIDFEIARLASQPRWEADLAAQRDLLEHVFGIEARPGLREAPEEIGQVSRVGRVAQQR